MTVKINFEKQEFFLELIANKEILVYEDGRVFNCKTKRYIGYLGTKGYRTISYMHPISRRIYKIGLHRLIWLAFVGPLPDEMVINHKDGNKLNNHLSNLEVVTEAENSSHAHKMGLSTSYPYFNDPVHLLKRKAKASDIRQKFEETCARPHFLNENNSQWGSYWINDGTGRIKWKDSKGPIPEGYKRSPRAVRK